MFWGRRSKIRKLEASIRSTRQELDAVSALIGIFDLCIWLGMRKAAGCPFYNQLLDEAKKLLADTQSKIASDLYAYLRLLPPI